VSARIQNQAIAALRQTLIVVYLALVGCASTIPNIPTVRDQRAQELVERMGQQTLAVSENAARSHLYKFHLASLSPKGIAGMSLGNHVIYIDHDLAAKASYLEGYKLSLQKVIAHEIGHDVSNHVANSNAIAATFSMGQVAGQALSYLPGPIGWVGAGASWLFFGIGQTTLTLYSRSQELEADRKGIEYWKRLGLDCRLWVEHYQRLADRGEQGDFSHPTDGLLDQAKASCQRQPSSVPFAVQSGSTPPTENISEDETSNIESPPGTPQKAVESLKMELRGSQQLFEQYGVPLPQSGAPALRK